MSAAPVLTAPAASARSVRSTVAVWCEWFLRPAVLIRVVLYLTTVVYLRTVLFDYVFDDNHLIILNPWMESWRQVPTFFTHSFWSFTDAARGMDFYRPLVMLALASIRHLFGSAPGWFHLVATGIHVLATYLTYRLAVEITKDERVAAIGAGIFGLHPTRVETAAWISGMSDSLCLVFFLGSMIAYFKWRERTTDRTRSKYLWISLTLLLLALFSKEAAMFAPILIAIYEFASCKAELRERCLVTLRSAWPFAAVTAFALIVRFLVVPIPSGHPVNEIPFLTMLLTAPPVVLWYLGKQLWPVGLSVQYPILTLSNFSGFEIALSAVVVLSLAIVLFWAVRKSPTGIFLVSWFLLMLAPPVLYQFHLQQHDRYFYLPSVATSIGLAHLITKLRSVGQLVQAPAVAMIFLAMTALTIDYASYWDNDLKLFTRVVQIAPQNGHGLRYLAGIYINMRQPEKAEAMGQRLITDPKTRAIGWYILGAVRLEDRDYEAARDDMEKAVELSKPGQNLLPRVNLADIDMLMNRNDEAIEIYREELKNYPGMPYLQKRLAAALEAKAKETKDKEERANISMTHSPSPAAAR